MPGLKDKDRIIELQFGHLIIDRNRSFLSGVTDIVYCFTPSLADDKGNFLQAYDESVGTILEET